MVGIRQTGGRPFVSPVQPRTRPAPGEIKVKLRCGRCGAVLGWLIGDAEDGVRVWGPHPVVERVGGDLVSRDRSPGVKFQPHSFAGERATPFETGQAQAERVEYRCRRSCGAVYPRQRSKLVSAFVRAARSTRTSLTFDTDL